MSSDNAKKLLDFVDGEDIVNRPNIDNYVAVPTSSLLQRKTAMTDLYLKLAGGKMIKIAHKDKPIDVERIKRFSDKDVQYFYVLRSELSVVVKDLVRGAVMLGKMENVPLDLKTSKLLTIAETVYAELIRLPLTEDSLARAITISNELAATMTPKTDFNKAFSVIIDLGEDFSRHALSTVILANLLGQQLNWESPKVINTLTLGAFVHDIGLKELPTELLKKKRIDMTKEDIELYETHPVRGVTMLSSFPAISPDILRIVQEHHEIPNGQGFPSHLRGERIYLPAKIVSLASLLAHDLFDSVPVDKLLDFERVRAKIDNVYATQFGSELTRALKKVFTEKLV